MIKKILLGLLAVIALVAIGGGGFVFSKVSSFDAELAKKWDVPVPAITAATDPAALERGKHLAESLGACTGCHGENLGGGKVENLGPIGTFKLPNITAGKNGMLAQYSDGELARLIRHGIKKDGTSVRFMPSQDWAWWSDEDTAALIGYLRTVPAVDGEPGSAEVGVLGKILDQTGKFNLVVARGIDHGAKPSAPAPSESPEYGAYVAKLCTGCHGEQLSGGPLPGAPPELPVPLNLTMHETGLKGWEFADFDKALRTGVRKNGQTINPFMPIESTKKFNETEMKALFAYLQSRPAKAFGGR